MMMIWEMSAPRSEHAWCTKYIVHAHPKEFFILSTRRIQLRERRSEIWNVYASDVTTSSLLSQQPTFNKKCARRRSGLSLSVNRTHTHFLWKRSVCINIRENMFFSEESSNWWFVDFRHFLVPGLHWINLTLSKSTSKFNVWIRLWNYEALFEPSMKLFHHITHRAARKCSTIFQFTSSILNWIIFELSGIAPRKQMLSVIQYTIVDFPPERSYEKREFFFMLFDSPHRNVHTMLNGWFVDWKMQTRCRGLSRYMREERASVRAEKKHRRIRSRTTGLTFRPSTRPIDINYWKILAGGGAEF